MDEIIRVFRSAPEVMPPEWAQDQRLSYGARGLLGLIMTHGGEWDVDAEGIAALNPKDSVEEIRGYIAELVREGYIDPESLDK
ncbi:MAG: hypothetical protein HOY69_22185 [Streptomyces sp.]|nr:hypothetical protein [Streptomyces sp.]